MRFGLKTFLILLGLIGLALGLLGSAVVHVRSASARIASEQHARFIAMEICNHAQSHNGVLPSAIEYDSETGKPMQSWRLVTCRFLFGDMVQAGFYGQGPDSLYSFPWDHPSNAVYRNGPHRDYAGGPWSFTDQTIGDQTTRYVAIVGDDTAFDPSADIQLSDLDDDTILFVEVRKSNHHWMEPGGDLKLSDMPAKIDVENGSGISGRHPDGFIVVFADTEAWTLSNDTPFEILEKFFTITSSKLVDKTELLSEFRR